MGLKTNKVTKTSRLNCQYVGSFHVSDGKRKLSSSEQNTFVLEKLKSCKKKLLGGIAVFLEVSPDGVKVLADDEKTIKMAHSLRRISYATAETSNKLFAYVSHQPGTDMEIVCHTFLTKKKDHAEGLSAVLGKLFKQTFAYTLKRRDKLDEAVQKRGANRRWAKQQVAEGHKGTPPRGGRRVPNQGSTETNEPRRPRDPATSAMVSEPRSPTREHPSSSARTDPTNEVPGSLQNQSRPARPGPPEGQTAAPARASEPSIPERESPSFPARTNPTNGLPGSLQNQSRPGRTVGPPEDQTAAPTKASEPSIPERESPFFPARTNPTNGLAGSLQNQSRSARTVGPSEDETTAPVRASEPSSPQRESGPSSTTGSIPENEAPPLPKRNFGDTNIPASGPRRFSEPTSPTREIPCSPIRRDPANDPPPRLPKRNNSDTSKGSRSVEKQPRAVNAMAPGSEAESQHHRKLSAPPDLIPRSPSNDDRLGKASSHSEEVEPTWLATSAPSRGLQLAASALLEEAGDIPPPLPRRQWESMEQHGTTIPPVQEEVICVEEDDDLRKMDKTVGPRASVILEDEDWYIPGVSRDMVAEMLESSDIGTFFVRDSQSQPGQYALTMKVLIGPNNPSGFGNYLIVPVKDGFTLQGFDKVFPDIFTLIRHYASEEDGLPCRLVLAGSNPLFHDANGYLMEFMDEEDEAYSSLSNCTSMFRELEMNGDPWQ